MLSLSPLSLSLTPNSHHTIVIYKNAYYSFYLPIACAMLFSNIPSSHEHIYTHAKSILLPLSEYFQIQDDFLDYSATPEVLGKIGVFVGHQHRFTPHFGRRGNRIHSG